VPAVVRLDLILVVAQVDAWAFRVDRAGETVPALVRLDLLVGGLRPFFQLWITLFRHAYLHRGVITDVHKTTNRGESSVPVPQFLTTRLIDGVAELSELLAAGDAEPAGGPISAVVATWAASLAAAAADRSRDRWDEAGAARAQAQALRRRALALAERDVAAYAVAREALAGRSGGGEPNQMRDERDEARDWRLGQVVKDAAEPPFELASCALDIAQLAQLIAAHAADDIRADAAIAAMLAAAAARGAAYLVEINLVVGSDEPHVERARACAEAAAAAAAAAIQLDA
jgi:methenyltetrahydrofolate cyclohydrolase